jgi:hypothetical protein
MIDVSLAKSPNFHYGRITQVSYTGLGLLAIPVPANLFQRKIWMGVETAGVTVQSFTGEIVALKVGQIMFSIPFVLNWTGGVLVAPLLFYSQDSFNSLIQPDTIEAAFTGGQRLTALSFISMADQIGINIRQNTMAINSTIQFHVRSQTKL